MFCKKYTYSLMIAIIFMILISCLSATEPTVYKRLRQFNDLRYSTPTGSCNIDKQYFYRRDNPILIDSMSYQVDNYFPPFFWQTFHYDGSVQNTNEGMRIEYFVNIVGQTNPHSHCFYEMNGQGRVTRTHKDSWDMASNSYVNPQDIYRHYNTAGYADSLYYNRFPETHNYIMRTFNDSMLQSTVLYDNGPDNWTPNYRYTYTYPDNPVELPSSLRFDSLIAQSMNYSLMDFEQIYNPKYVPASMAREWWNGNEWEPEPHYEFTESIYNNQIVLRKSFNMAGYQAENALYANLAGDIMEYLYSWHVTDTEEGGGAREYYTWDTGVAVDDGLAPEPVNSLNTYPNPFINELKISLNSKDNAPADITIYNIKGQLVRQWQSTKTNELVWDGKDAANKTVSSGIYLIKSRQGKLTSTAKVIKL